MDYKVFEKYVKPEIQVVELNVEKFLSTSDESEEGEEILINPIENGGGLINWNLY